MKTIIANAIKKAMNYSEYNLLFKQLAEEGRTTGEQTLEKINYTKLNFSRSKRLDSGSAGGALFVWRRCCGYERKNFYW